MSMDKLMARATAELRTNPTIRVYEYTKNGLKLQRPANPFAGFICAAQQATEVFQEIGEAMASLLTNLTRGNPGGDL